MADPYDDLQNYWNFWWVDYAIKELGQSPWHTYFQFFPTGSSLVLHTLSIVNTLQVIFLSPFLSLIQIYNLTVISSFILTGIPSGLLIQSFGVGRFG